MRIVNLPAIRLSFLVRDPPSWRNCTARSGFRGQAQIFAGSMHLRIPAIDRTRLHPVDVAPNPAFAHPEQTGIPGTRRPAFLQKPRSSCQPLRRAGPFSVPEFFRSGPSWPEAAA
ncbi:hypothetical protein LNKW23_37310 [Paralimibaculum aggregatum]|uniref:Uncharacterized protein n=1 Tax=Paralimibaculum aggregatum TaxID=3036245 RepID=A0ABQ6LPY7_9RHOB|nr:hypothetical protein LNKW23_37310 [Limibaculum sp. NKW23]